MIEPRPYSSEWHDAESQPLQTPFGQLTIKPLGWGIRVESGPDDEPLVINRGQVRLAWADYVYQDGEWCINNDKVSLRRVGNYGVDDASPKQTAKLAEVLPALVTAWAEENADEVERRRRAWISDRARRCEESILQLEVALAAFRERLVQIEAGDMEVSPYLNREAGFLHG